MHNVILQILRVLVWYLPLPQSLRDMVMWPVATRLLKKGLEYEVVLPNGARLSTDLSDQLTRSLLFYGTRTLYFWEPTTTRLVELLASHHSRILIAGAHIGLEAVIARYAAPKDALVVTCEPAPYLSRFARTNATQNANAGTVIVEEVALTEKIGTVSFALDTLKSRIVTNGGGITVPATTIDTLGEKHGMFGMALLDIEGHEYDALRGAVTHLSSGALTDIIFEVSLRMLSDPLALSKTEALLAGCGYMFYRIEDEYHMGHPTSNIPQVTLRHLRTLNLDAFPERYHNVLATRRSFESLSALVSCILVE